jgi:hypothetical protein
MRLANRNCTGPCRSRTGGTADAGVLYRADPSCQESVLKAFPRSDGKSCTTMIRESAGNLYGTFVNGVFGFDTACHYSVLEARRIFPVAGRFLPIRTFPRNRRPFTATTRASPRAAARAISGTTSMRSDESGSLPGGADAELFAWRHRFPANAHGKAAKRSTQSQARQGMSLSD